MSLFCLSVPPSVPTADPARTWPKAECAALFQRIAGLTTGGGETSVTMRLSWLGNLRWARNRPTTAAVMRNRRVVIRRYLNGRHVVTETTQLDDAALKQTIQELEQRCTQLGAGPREELDFAPAQQYLASPLWSDTTFNITEQGRSDAARVGVLPVRAASLLAAGCLETRVETWAIFNTKGLEAHATGTMASYSETVRNPEGTGSGWAGLTHTDWTTLNVAHLAARALQKCVASANPRAIEPGRYTVILEPQVVSRFFMFAVRAMDRGRNEAGDWPYSGVEPGTTLIGQRVFDERITISTDPMDPNCPYIPFDEGGWPYRPVTWVEKGVLKELSYDHAYAHKNLGTEIPLPNPHAYRMSGGDTSIEEMIATTERGVLVTNTNLGNPAGGGKALLVSTSTRDGLWLIEKGKIKFPVKNMRVLESPMYIGNNVLQLGRPERVFGVYWHGDQVDTFPPQALGNIPIIVPPMKVRDFNFIALSDAV